MISPGYFTAIPSANVNTGPSATAPPQYGAHAAACTPTTRTCGSSDLTAMATPDASPPPPSGTTTHDSDSMSSTNSRPIVPWPSITATSSKGGQNVVPRSRARSIDSATASFSAAPCSMTVAP